MKVIKDAVTFYERTGIVWVYEELMHLGIVPQFSLSLFEQKDLPRLRAFCKANPGYHILSGISPLMTVNYEVPDARCFRLGDGDADPELTYVRTEMINPFPAYQTIRKAASR